MTTNNSSSAGEQPTRYQIEHPQVDDIKLKRGGRLGLTLEHVTFEQSKTAMGLTILMGMIMAVTGAVYGTGLFAPVLMISGGLMTGLATERLATIHGAEEVYQ